jgi:D-alanyl-D-alanine carboxypeptidase
MVASAKRDGRRLIGVVLGSRNGGARTLEMKRLLDEGFSGGAMPATDLVALADQLIETDGEAPPTILAGAACAAPQLVGSSLIDSPDELSGWAVALGDFRTRSKAQRALQDAQTKLGAAARGRPAILKQGTNRLSRYSVLFAGLEQSSAQSTCEALSATSTYCVTLSPKILETRFARDR